jgi:hypothetical protein
MSQSDNPPDVVASAAPATVRPASTLTVISSLRSVLTLRPWPGGWLLAWVLFTATNFGNRSGRPAAIKPPKPSRDIGAKVRALRFIHASHFGLIRRLPSQGQPPDDVRKCLLLFVSDYDGGFAEYIDGFSALIPGGMKLFWGTSYGFPGPQPVTPFRDYVEANEFRADHEYSAHPRSSTRTIVSALAFRDLHEPFRERAAKLSPRDFDDKYRKLVTEAQESL